MQEKRGRQSLPEVVVKRAEAAGETGKQWLENLDGMIAELESRWQVEAGPAMDGGTHGFAAIARDRDGREYVMKLDRPEEDVDFMREVRLLDAAQGRGYARLYAWDEDTRATLMERLGKPLGHTDLPVEEQLAAIAATLQDAWTINAPGLDLPDGQGSVDWFREAIPETYERLGHPCAERAIRQALAFLDHRERCIDPAAYVLVHGDAHATNLLADPAHPGRYKLVDPDGLYCEKAYDLGVLMREWTNDYMPDPLERGVARCRYLHELTGVDAQAIWEWGLIQCVCTGLIFWEVDETVAGLLLKVAEAWCDRPEIG